MRSMGSVLSARAWATAGVCMSATLRPRAAVLQPCPASCSCQPRSVPLRPRRRAMRQHAVVCRASAKSFYDVLGVPSTASERDIKSAYRKKAMKLHPDVNKAPDAQQRFMEARVAYETLSDNSKRAEYDRRLRMGFRGSGAGRSGYSSTGAWDNFSAGAGFGTQPPDLGWDDLIRELDKEFTAWANQKRAKGGKDKSLVEELEGLGEELLDFLEDALGIKDEPAGKQTGGASYSAPNARSASEKFDQFWAQYGDGTGAASTSSQQQQQKSSSAPPPRPPPPPPPPPKAARPEDDIEEQLKALKRKFNKA